MAKGYRALRNNERISSRNSDFLCIDSTIRERVRQPDTRVDQRQLAHRLRMILITSMSVANYRQLVDFLLNFCELVEPNPVLIRVKREPTGIT